MTEQAPFLARPSADYKDSYIAALKEHQQVDGDNPPWHYGKLLNAFDDYVQMRLMDETHPAAGWVPQTHYWLIVDGEYAGRLSIRHRLTNNLRKFGGHIGYEIRPSLRRKGYGYLQLRLGLEKARELGLEHVLLTCDDDNIGSIKIIEGAGGERQDKIDNGRGVLTRRYWIAL